MEQFGRYRLLRRLAAGGMGEIFLALDDQGQEFAVKRLLPEHRDKPSFVETFFNEARLARALAHPQVCRVLEMGAVEGRPYIAMEYVPGRSLRALMDRLLREGRRFAVGEAVQVGRSLLSALEHVHAARGEDGAPLGLVHQDVNPDNVLLSHRGELKLIDFGVASTAAEGTIRGKFAYMSPEQSAAEPIDHRSDLFAVGVVLHEMLTGRHPFASTNLVLSLDAIQNHPAPTLAEVRPEAGALAPVLERALAKSPEERFPSARAFVDALDAASPADGDGLATLCGAAFEGVRSEDETWLEQARAGCLGTLRVTSESPVRVGLADAGLRPTPARLAIMPGERRLVVSVPDGRRFSLPFSASAGGLRFGPGTLDPGHAKRVRVGGEAIVTLRFDSTPFG